MADDPSGFGRYGIFDANEHGVLCHDCGDRFAKLGIHVRLTHHCSMEEYRALHGIEQWTPGPFFTDSPRRRAHPCRRCGTILIRPQKLQSPIRC